ncbi:MAG: RES family NAD+ phosphorylase [Daejeonella sp.]
MLVFRIGLAKYATGLIASGMAARWNSNDMKVIYTSSSRSLACLENVVHRSQLGLSGNFSVLTIEIPDGTRILNQDLKELPENWNTFELMHITQNIGDKWINDNKALTFRVPSSIIPSEFNYLINPAHADFSKIRHLKTEPFVFDDRIKR